MIRKGLGENTEFASFHPIVNVVFFVVAVGITMFSMSPYFLALTLVFSLAYSILLKGKKSVKFNIIIGCTTLILSVFINTFFTHNGDTVLFYINTNAITLEAMIFGIASGILLISIIVWFTCFNVIMTSDKLIYIFGKAAPVLGLTLSMIFRFVPLLKNRFAEISMGQKCMGRGSGTGGIVSKIRQLVKEISILIAWSLEASIESADSMEARGYGLKGRTEFFLYRISKRDLVALAVMAVLAIPVVMGCFMKITNMYYYPKIGWPPLESETAALMICYGLFLAMPLMIDIFGERRWRQLDLKM